MTYNTGGAIQALDYNTFATLTGGVNEIYADMHSGATTVSAGADYGYGQSPLTSVSVGNAITAAQWSDLFTVMKKCGTHQGTTTIPPLPATNPVIGNTIVPFNTPTTLSSLVTTLRTNRFNLALGESSQSTATSSGTSAPWTNALSYTFSVNLGTWDQARYFFNSGGWIGVAGSYPGSGYPTNTDDYQWYHFLNQLGVIKMQAKATSSNLSSSGLGLWNTFGNPLTTSFQTVYSRNYGGSGYYTASTVSLEAKLAAAAGTNGIIDFRINLNQADTSPPADPKNLSTTFTLYETHAAGTFLWPGSAVITPGTFTRT